MQINIKKGIVVTNYPPITIHNSLIFTNFAVD